jgi:hypothetical protein
VPTRHDLLAPPARRPTEFRRGHDVYDPVRVGVVTAGAKAERLGTRHEVGAKGGGNAGHAFGTELPADDKDALVAYLMTL